MVPSFRLEAASALERPLKTRAMVPDVVATLSWPQYSEPQTAQSLSPLAAMHSFPPAETAVPSSFAYTVLPPAETVLTAEVACSKPETTVEARGLRGHGGNGEDASLLPFRAPRASTGVSCPGA